MSARRPSEQKSQFSALIELIRQQLTDRLIRTDRHITSATAAVSNRCASTGYGHDSPTSLRRSYITHLIEDGWDPLFVQQQVGHEHASTTAIYTCVSSDFRTRTLRRALDATLLTATEGTES
jgi:site-specific recombinase XerD